MLRWQAHFFFTYPDFFHLAIQIIFEQLSSNFSLSTEQKALKSFGSSLETAEFMASQYCHFRQYLLSYEPMLCIIPVVGLLAVAKTYKWALK